MLVVGERVSLVFGDDLPLGYRVMLARMLPMAEAAGDAELLTSIYFGQENRGAKSKSKCDRWQQHTTKWGCLNVAQIKFVTDRRNGYVYTPLGPVTMEARFIAMLPAGDNNSSRIDGAEALAFAACERIPGFISMNDSPPGEDARLLVATWAGPPRIFHLCSTLIDTLGGEEKAAKVKLCDPAAATAAGPFVRGVLEAVHLLMENEHFVDKSGQPLKADFKSSGRTRFAKFSVQTLVAAVYGSIDIDGGAATPQREYTLALWCDACSCRYIGPLCKHLLSARIVSRIRAVAPCWHGNAEALYWGAGPQPSYAVRCCTAEAEAPDSSNDDASLADHAAAADDLPALYAAVGHHLALMAERVAVGACDSSALASVATVLRSVVKRAEGWSGARIVEPGGASRRGGTLGAFSRRGGSTREVEADRASAPQLREALSQSARLELLVKTHPLPKGSPDGVIDDSSSSALAASVHAAAAASALSVAASRASTFVRASVRVPAAEVGSGAVAGHDALVAEECMEALLGLASGGSVAPTGTSAGDPPSRAAEDTGESPAALDRHHLSDSWHEADAGEPANTARQQAGDKRKRDA